MAHENKKKDLNTMIEIFGYFSETQRNDEEFLIIGFSPTSIPIKQRWRNNGLSADFVADYFTTFFPVSDEDPSTRERQMQIKGAVSYIANELLENAMKYNYEACQHPIKFGLYLQEEGNEGSVTIVMLATNSVSPTNFDKFKKFIQDLTSADPDEFYFNQLEKSAEDESIDSSGLGLVTMINDYGAKLGWKFESNPIHPEEIAVTTMVQFPL